MATGIHKAAVLLMSLDPNSAGELLRSAGPDLVRQIAAEVAYLQASGFQQRQASESLREFSTLLRQRREEKGDFVRKVLHSAVGEEQTKNILGQIGSLVHERDPFLVIRGAEVKALVGALEGESPQAAALVLCELPHRKCTELLSQLPEQVRNEAVRCLTSGATPSAGARLRVANVIRDRLRPAQEGGAAPSAARNDEARQEKLRRVAVVLRGLEPGLRQVLLQSIAQGDAQAAGAVKDLMVTWQDISSIAAKPLQNALRSSDSRRLALALSGAEPVVAEKVRQNISERAKTMLDEEQELLKKPKPDEVLAAREVILKALREMNDQGQLEFEER